MVVVKAPITFLRIIGAFNGHFWINFAKLLNIDIPSNSNLQLIGKNAFNRNQFESISLPVHLKKIDKCAFYSCKNLKTVTIPKNSELQEICESAFDSSSLEFMSIPSKVTKIGNSAFHSCQFLKSVEFSENSELQIIEESR